MSNKIMKKKVKDKKKRSKNKIKKFIFYAVIAVLVILFIKWLCNCVNEYVDLDKVCPIHEFVAPKIDNFNKKQSSKIQSTSTTPSAPTLPTSGP